MSSSIQAPLSKRRRLVSLAFAALLIAGCARLKQCAYEGFNRDAWQQPAKVIAALNLRPGEAVADLGSGGGYFTFKLAAAVAPGGKVYAVDIDKDMVELLGARAKKDPQANVEAILAKADDPMLPGGGVDLIFTCDTYHHLGDRISYFKNLRKYLRPDGRIAIIDFDRRAWLEGLFRHYTPSEFIKREMEQAGYSLHQELDFLDRQSFLIFTPKR
jgi:ubiquinone/menaquinone biosynthesis C-methylase UbiE